MRSESPFFMPGMETPEAITRGGTFEEHEADGHAVQLLRADGLGSLVRGAAMLLVARSTRHPISRQGIAKSSAARLRLLLDMNDKTKAAS